MIYLALLVTSVVEDFFLTGAVLDDSEDPDNAGETFLLNVGDTDFFPNGCGTLLGTLFGTLFDGVIRVEFPVSLELDAENKIK